MPLTRRHHATELARLNQAQSDHFGTVVTRPDGQVVSGVFARRPAPESPWPEIGAALKLSRQTNPEVHLLTADAVGLVPNAALTIAVERTPSGGTVTERFLIVEVEAAAEGWVRVTLLPDPAGAPRPAAGSRWQ
jgi:hypothetical protein